MCNITKFSFMFDLNELKDKNQIKIHCTINYVFFLLIKLIIIMHACTYNVYMSVVY